MNASSLVMNLVPWMAAIVQVVIVLSLLIALALMVLSLRQAQGMKRRQRRIQELQSYLFAAMHHQVPLSSAHLPRLDSVLDVEVMMDMMLQLTRLVDGDDLRPALRLYVLLDQIGPLCRLAQSRDLSLAIRALTLMGHMDDSDTEAALVQTLQSEQPSRRLAAMHALAMRGAREHLGRVLEAMSLGGGSDRMFANALALFGPEAAGILMAWQTRLQTRPKVLAATLRVLSAWEHVGCEQALAQALRHADALVREVALNALRRHRRTPDPALLERLRSDPSNLVRAALAQLRGEGMAYFNVLRQLLHDRDRQVVTDAVLGMAAAGPRGRAYLQAQSHGENKLFADLCRRALAEHIHDPLTRKPATP